MYHHRHRNHGVRNKSQQTKSQMMIWYFVQLIFIMRWKSSQRCGINHNDHDDNGEIPNYHWWFIPTTITMTMFSCKNSMKRKKSGIGSLCELVLWMDPHVRSIRTRGEETKWNAINVKFDQMNDQRLWCSGSRLPIKWVNLSPSRRRSRESKTLKRKGQYVRVAECQITQSTLKWEWFVCWQDFLFGDCVRVHQRRQEWRKNWKNDVTPFKL